MPRPNSQISLTHLAQGARRLFQLIAGMLSMIAVSATMAATPALAHDSRPLFIELTELGGRAIDLKSTAPAAIDRENAPRVTLLEPCTEQRREAADPLRQHALFHCALEEATVAIEWPAYNPSISALVRVSYANGETRTAILEPSQNQWRAPAPDSFEGVARSYFLLGGKHILGGVDHLLFLGGLLLISGTLRRIMITITGFTLAHSVTLALVALGLVRVSIPATEAVIALSIVFLAVEIARGDKTTLAWRRPSLVASAFGLVHGAGFAAALGEIGLPKTETIAALLFFNVGVEAGQIAIIAALLLALSAARPFLSLPFAGARRERVAGYGLGIISAYWFIERLAAILA